MDRPTQPEGHPLASDPYFTLMADAEGVGYVHGGDGMRVVRMGGLGSLASLCGMDQLKQVLDDEVPFQQFLDLCERFDREIMPDGPGTRQRAGLIAVGERAGQRTRAWIPRWRSALSRWDTASITSRDFRSVAR